MGNSPNDFCHPPKPDRLIPCLTLWNVSFAYSRVREFVEWAVFLTGIVLLIRHRTAHQKRFLMTDYCRIQTG